MKYLTLDHLQDEYLLEPIVEYDNIVIDERPEPLVSVLIITYQHSLYIRKCLDSVMNQETSFQFEIILCDDGSTDGTREICIEYANKYPSRIRLFLNSRRNNRSILGKPCGIIQFVNGLLNTRGKYVSICSGDDHWLDVTKIQQQTEFLETSEHCSLVYHKWVERSVSEDGLNESFSDTFKKFPKASTMTYRNIGSELPEQILNVLQEDVFTWFILSNKGEFTYLDEVEATVVNTPASSLSRSIDAMTHFRHVLNVHSQIILAFKNTPYEKKSKLRLVSYVRGISLGKNRQFFKASIIRAAWREILHQRLVVLFFTDSARKLATKYRNNKQQIFSSQ